MKLTTRELLNIQITKEDIEKLLYGEKLQVNDGEYAVTIILEEKQCQNQL